MAQPLGGHVGKCCSHHGARFRRSAPIGCLGLFRAAERSGRVAPRAFPSQRHATQAWTLSTLAAFAAERGETIDVTGTFEHTGAKPFSYGTHAAHVAVDPRTGRVKLIDFIAIEDIGRVLNPLIAHGQALGAIVQGLGGTFMEHLRYDEDGQLLTASLADYLLPTAADFPAIRGEVHGIGAGSRKPARRQRRRRRRDRRSGCGRDQRRICRAFVVRGASLRPAHLSRRASGELIRSSQSKSSMNDNGDA